mmetsp:Transcript_128397/g.324076  ORF Transcript_128397/g.324076 Transcript_128397/m.324076 type:complete len:119 (-) Transcript_128397:181-537(-)
MQPFRPFILTTTKEIPVILATRKAAIAAPLHRHAQTLKAVFLRDKPAKIARCQRKFSRSSLSSMIVAKFLDPSEVARAAVGLQDEQVCNTINQAHSRHHKIHNVTAYVCASLRNIRFG